MVTTTERPLTAPERQALSRRLDNARSQRRMALAKTGGASGLVCGGLAVVTLAASTAPWWVVALFWSGLAAVLTLWIGLPWHRLMGQQVASLDDAFQASQARVTRVQSRRVVEFEEEEDEGACYAFEHDAGASLFIVGQEFYEDDDFPCSDFSIVDLLGTGGQPVDTFIEKHGPKLTPERVVPAAVKRRLLIPEHLTVVPAPLETVEAALSRSRTDG